MKKLFLALIGFVLLSSCGSTLFSDISDQDDLEKVKESMLEEFGDMDVFYLNLSANEHLNSNFYSSRIKYLKEQEICYRTYLGFKLLDEDIQPDWISEGIIDDCQGKIKISELDFSIVSTKFQEALEMTPQGYENFYLYSWEFLVSNDNKVSAQFIVEGVEAGSTVEFDGNSLNTTYYEFFFTMDSDGNLTLN